MTSSLPQSSHPLREKKHIWGEDRLVHTFSYVRAQPIVPEFRIQFLFMQ